MSYTCPDCGKTSFHPVDEVEGYCGACHKYTRLPQLLQDEATSRETIREQVGVLEKAAEVAFQLQNYDIANQLYGLISKLAATNPGTILQFPKTDMRLIGNKASLSRLLWDAREIASMFGDVIDSRVAGKSTWAIRIVKEIDAFREAQGWSPNGFGGE